ncbi:phosphotransferase [Aeromicrobium ponti]|uniref:Ser/Thr protein kinase RdoA (MazF antagonist) n=1 Tax=Cytobacillus oceanisediminis TaxID=665099 RepID=A0A562JRI2_9BACI|nr:phosphotransferase [Cytobacillus oceanisediminis]TWH85595.1 Ser/Thr protein kinase RdoA (MazF antagonist) [Cytobacillus oceanisediminis]
MEKAVEALMTVNILSEFLLVYSMDKKDYKKLGDFENYVYEVYRNEESYILRITHSSHRKHEEILAEVDWVNYLNQQGVKVPEVFQSDHGKIVESVSAEDGSFFYASVFSKAPGKSIKVTAPEFNEKLFEAWGRAIGKMHKETKAYTPPFSLAHRMQWDEEELLNVEKYVPEADKLVIINTKELLKQLQSLPKNKDTFGLIHTDIHSGNFFYDGSDIHIFDFDDCCYHWLASDIAIPLYYALLYRCKEANADERSAFGKLFLDSFLKGYQEKNPLPKDWEIQLPLFLRLRDVTLYSVLYKKIAPEDRDQNLLLMLKQIKNRIERKESIY